MGTHRFQLDSINATEVGNLSEPGLVASTLAGRPQIDVTLANDALLPDLVIAMAQFGYAFLASAPTTPRATSNLIVDLSDPGVSPLAPAGTYRQRYDNTQKALVVSVDGGAYFPLAVTPVNGACFFDDFLASSGTNIGSTNWLSVSSGTASSVSCGPGAAPAAIDGSHQGILLMNTGSTATGRGSARHPGPGYSNIAIAGGNTRIEFLASRVDAPSNGVDNYSMMFGYSDTIAAGFGANAALITHDPAVSLTNWVIKTIVTSVVTSTTTAIPISAAGTWDKLLIDISSGSAARFFVNGVLAATHALGTLPLVTVPWAPIAKIEKTLGGGLPTNARRMAVDYASWSYRLSAAR